MLKFLIALALISNSYAQFIPFAMWNNSTPPVTDGYFVYSHNQFDGNLGGLTGADSTCYTEVTTYDWMGKSSAGTLTTARVKAFLCDSSTCNNLDASTTYYFARANQVSTGGASFTTNGSGQGPGNGSSWSGSTFFNHASELHWTGRGFGSSTLWSNSPFVSHCSDWASASGAVSGGIGNTNGTDHTRWMGTITCNGPLYLICVVNPP